MRISKKGGEIWNFKSEYLIKISIVPLKNYKSNLTNFVKVSLRRFYEVKNSRRVYEVWLQFRMIYSFCFNLTKMDCISNRGYFSEIKLVLFFSARYKI